MEVINFCANNYLWVFHSSSVIHYVIDQTRAADVTHQFAVEDFEQGFAAMLSGQSGKVILNWG